MIIVESMRPITIRIVWAFRRGILRTPNLKITGRRHAIHATEIKQMASSTNKTIMIVVIEMPKISFIYRAPFDLDALAQSTALLLVDRLSDSLNRRRDEIETLADDQSISHLDNAVALSANAGVVGHKHHCHLLIGVELAHEIHDFGRGF